MLRELWGTPFSETIWNAAEASLADDDRVRRATAFFIRARQSRQGLGKDFATPTSRLRRGMNENVSAWWSAVEGLPEIHTRLKRVEIRNLPALDFIQKYDHPQALFYCDPPYHPDTRTVKDAYNFEMTDRDHWELLDTLSQIQGRFLLSGYNCPLYESFSSQKGWNRDQIDIDNKSGSGATKQRRLECLWMNF
jgi:DNA adenine methylase